MSGHKPWQELHPKTADVDTDRRGWAAHIDCAGDPAGADDSLEEQLLAFVEELLLVGGCPGSTTSSDRYGATFSVYTDSNSVTEVIDQALAIFLTAVRAADLPPWPIVRCDVMTFAEQDADVDG